MLIKNRAKIEGVIALLIDKASVNTIQDNRKEQIQPKIRPHWVCKISKTEGSAAKHKPIKQQDEVTRHYQEVADKSHGKHNF